MSYCKPGDEPRAVVVDRINGLPCEIKYTATDGTLVGYWAYGSFDPELPYRGTLMNRSTCDEHGVTYEDHLALMDTGKPTIFDNIVTLILAITLVLTISSIVS